MWKYICWRCVETSTLIFFTGSWSISQSFASQFSNTPTKDPPEDSLNDQIAEVMSVANRDRTTEFQSVLKSIKTRQVYVRALFKMKNSILYKFVVLIASLYKITLSLTIWSRCQWWVDSTLWVGITYIFSQMELHPTQMLKLLYCNEVNFQNTPSKHFSCYNILYQMQWMIKDKS